MTAEIAILNKSAVALATDSAVTISSGNSNHKVFDSADKLFELSCDQPLGVMIYNGMQFADIPLPDLLKEFRAGAGHFDKVEDAAHALLKFLSDIGVDAPESARNKVLSQITLPLIAHIDQRIEDNIRKRILDTDESPADFDSFVTETAEKVVRLFEFIAEKLSPTSFYEDEPPASLTKNEIEWVSVIVQERMPALDSAMRDRVIRILEKFIISGELSASKTGIVVAGFGNKERFPSLISHEVEGVVSGKLKLKQTAACDIDRNGPRAFIMPFAQKEMVERFIYGADSNIQRVLSAYCKDAIGLISREIISKLEADSYAEIESLKRSIADAEAAFLDNLKSDAFTALEDKSRGAIEDMIEFMPKPELAKMAEALVELTSMKRKVSAGMETVGGPVDVAVISKSEGFIWIKRKHYFSPELNARYLTRLRK